MQRENILSQGLCYRNIVDEYNLGLNVSIIGFEKCSKSKPLIDSNKSCYVLHFVLSGAGYLTIDNKTKMIHEGECFLITPNSHIKYRPDPKNPWSYFWLELNGNMVKKIVSSVAFSSNHMHLVLSDFDTIKEFFLDLLDEDMFLRSPNAEVLRINAIILNILSNIIADHGNEDTSPSLSKEENQIKKIVDYIHSNYTSPTLTIKKIADYFFFNQAYLTRIFKKNMGVSPMKYIIYLRMQRAVELLQKNAFTISQIAYAVGYKNQFYFSKEFKHYFGVQPSKYLH